MKKSAHIDIYGVVQGVGMRYSVFKKAVSLGLCGYVKNKADGSVKVVAEGEEQAINQLVEYIKSDVRWAQVDDVIVTWREFSGLYNQFEITF
jgi:acylphosphatase